MEHPSPFRKDVASVRELIDRAAGEWAEATFLIAPESGATLSFDDLRRRSARLAHRLLGLGLGRGDKVALACDNGVAAAELLLGSMYGGFVPVPLNVGAGRSSLVYALEHSDARVLFASGDRRALAETLVAALERPIRVIPVPAEAERDRDEPESAVDVLPDVEPHDDALLIYTSGSTGQAKGVLHAQRNVLACGRNTVLAHELEQDDRFLCVLPLYHMNSVDKLLGVLWSGGSLVLPRRFDLAAYWRQVAEHRCTWLALVPTLVSLLASRPAPDASTLEHVRFARCSSAPLRSEQRSAFEKKFEMPLLEGMGMTEAGGIFLNPVPPKEAKAGALGVPHGIDVRILDAQGKELGPDQPGEIAVRGPSVMKGYYKDADATASSLDEVGWLHTGDRGYRDEDGTFFHTGRLKELIIKAGTNIAPDEVEEALEAHPAVREAAVVGVPDTYLGEEIVAYVVLEPDARDPKGALLDHCKQLLGVLKTPARIEVIADLPRGPSGKVLRAKLRDLAEQPPVTPGEDGRAATSGIRAGGEDHPATRTRIEEALRREWAEALEREHVGVHEDFFALGGYSLLALRMLSRLKKRLSVEIPLGVFVEAPTIAEQVPIVASQLRQRGNSRALHALLLAPIRAGCTAPPLFCVYGPSRYRFLARHLGPDQPTYGVFAEQDLEIADPSGRPVRFPSVEELAARYLEEVKIIQPAGPYHLVGASFGGRVALEMAQAFRSEGQEVGLLAVLDTYMPTAAMWLPWRWFTHHLRQSLRGGPPYVAAALRQRIGRRMTRIRVLRAVASGSEGIGAEAREAEFRHRARERHRIRPYTGKVVLFRATEPIAYSPGYRVDPLLGWGDLAREGVDVHDVPGTHLGILREPNARVLAEKIRAYLPPPAPPVP